MNVAEAIRIAVIAWGCALWVNILAQVILMWAQRRRELFSFRVASLFGVSYIILSLAGHLNTPYLTWRSPVAVVVFAMLTRGFWLRFQREKRFGAIWGGHDAEHREERERERAAHR